MRWQSGLDKPFLNYQIGQPQRLGVSLIDNAKFIVNINFVENYPLIIMKNISIKSSLFGAMMLVLTACGGGGGGGVQTQVGQFVDDPVQGLTYRCVDSTNEAGATSGTTNAQGQFNYVAGQTCTFKVGNVTIGSLSSIPSDGVVTPQDVAGVSRTATNAPTATVIAQFLQSLDDGSGTGKIVIPASISTSLESSPAVSLISDAGPLAQASLSGLVSSVGKFLIPASQASSALATQLTTAGVSSSAGNVSPSVPATLNSVSVSVANASNAAGLSEQLTALANMSDGTSTVATSTVTWSSDNTSVLTVDASGLATGLKPGTATVTATKGNLKGSVSLTVTDAVLTSISVSSANINLPLGLTQTLTANGTYSDGSSKAIATGVVWSGNNDNVTVSGSGVVTAKAVGSTLVTATVGGIHASVTVQGTRAVLQSIAVSTSDAVSAVNLASGLSKQLQAQGLYSDNTTQDLSSALTWRSSGSNVAVSASGLLTTSGQGTSTVTASDADSAVSGTFTVTVTPAVLSSLALSPATPSIAAGLNQQLTLTGTYSDGSTSANLSNVTWTSSSTANAAVASNGLVSGVAKGTATVSVSVSGLSASAVLTVTDPVVQSLSISSVLSSISNGASTVLTAIANFSNSTTELVTSAVRWVVTSLGGSATVDSTQSGVILTGTSPGNVSLQAFYNDIASSILNLTITPSVSGVAANGAAMMGATVTLTDVTGKTLTTTAGDDGSFNFPDLTGYTVPFQLSASAQVGAKQVTQYSIYANALANGNNTVNITPLTSAIVGLVAPSGVLSDLTPSQLSSITPSQISAASSQIMAVVAPVAANIAGANNFNPITTSFAANGLGVDRLLDHLDVAVRPDGVDISNKMAVPTGDSSSQSSASLVKGSSAVATPLASADAVDLAGIDTLVNQFKACFAVSSTQRLTNKTVSSATLADACKVMALPNYLHNGNTFMSRWAGLLNSAAIDSATKVARPEIRLRLSSNPDVIAVNMNLVDNTGVGYTLPEIIQRQTDGSWKLYGSQRAINAFVETSLIHYQDMTPNTAYNNINYSRVETGFRFSFDPRVTFSGGVATNAGIDLTQTGGNSTKSWQEIRSSGGYSMVKCVVVTGPGAFYNGGPKWMGVFPYGLLLKRPSASPRQDYMAIDSRLTQSQNTSVVNANIGDTLNLCPDSGVADSGGVTTVSSNTYTVDLMPLTNQISPLTGVVDAAMNGRDRAWYTGPRFARVSPDAALTETLKSNPLFTYYVIDTNNTLQLKLNTRYLGDLPPLNQLTGMVTANKLPTWSKDSLSRYLNFATGQPSTNTVTANWSNPPTGFSADYAGFYSEVFQSMSGTGLRGASSTITRNRTGVGTDGLWNSDADLATYLDGLPGNNFFWNYASITKASDTNGNCTGSYLASTLGSGFYRGVTSLNNQGLGGTWYGTDDQATACKKIYNPSSPTPNSYVLREMYLRTYTDKNARVYKFVGNKNLQ